MDCINLRERFSKRYRIGWDPAYDAKGRHRHLLDPWMMTIPCERGTIYPHGGTRLAVEVEGRPITANRLRGLDCTTVIQEGDDFLAVTFDVDDFDRVAQIVLPRRRRQLSEAERERLRAAGANSRFQPRRTREVVAPQTASTAAT